LVLQVNLHYGVKHIVFDQAGNTLAVFGRDDSFEELYYLYVYLSGAELSKVCNFVKDLILNEEDSDNDWDRRVLN